MNSEEQYANLELGKTYDFMDYKWTACELINNGKTLVIQSHGVTCGTWPGFKMLKFGGKVDAFYATDIAGEDISAYDDKMQILYDVIKEVEDKSAPYGKGLFLVSAEKVQLPTVIYGASGAGYYCDALVSAGSEGNPNGTHCNAWLGTLGNKENTAWFVNGFANGYIALQDDVVKTIAPAFNIDLSKVVISGDEIVKKTQFISCLASNANPTADSVNINDSLITGVSMKGFTDANDESSSAVISTTNGFDFASMAVTTPSDNNLSANSNHTSMSAADAKTLFKDFAERLPSDTTLAVQVTPNPMIARIKCSKYNSQIANTLNMHFATSESLCSALSNEHSLLHEFLLLIEVKGYDTHYLGNILSAFIPENVSFPEIDLLYNLPKNSSFTNITVDRSTGEVVIEYNSANNGDAEFFRSLFAVCQGTIKYINIVPRDVNADLFNENCNSCGIHIDSVTDDSAVETRKAQFIIAEQGIAELAGAVTAQSDSSKELTDSSQYRSIWEYGMDLTKDGETFHLDPEMVSQIYEAITEDNGRNYVATYTSRKFTREQYIAICDEVENLLMNDSVEYRACEHVLGKGFDNYTDQPTSDNLPKKLDL